MAATKTDIKRWLDTGIEKDATHVIVAVDTFDYEDYPVYVGKDEDINKEVARFNREEKTDKIMEVYKLSMNLDLQMSQNRAWNL